MHNSIATRSALAISLAATAACPSDGGSDSGNADTGIGSGGDDGATSAAPSTGAESTGAGGPGTSSGGVDGSGGTAPFPMPPVKLDLGLIPDSPEIESGCRAVDFLFVVDNSGSMIGEQTNLVNNWPAFIDGIQSTLTEVDSYHVAVTTTDAYTPNVAGCNVLGGFVVRTGGTDSSNAMCGPYADGYNFMTENDDLGVAFNCAARVGTSGSFTEAPMDAVTTVANGIYDGPGLCNEGFLRDNALFVVVVLTDEADGPGDPEGSGSSGNPMTWYDAVVAAKDGIPENAAAVVLVNFNPGPCPGTGSSDGQNMVDFANLFGENGFVGGICEVDYGPIFDQVVGVVENACENFIPPG